MKANFEMQEIATSDFKHPLLKRVRFVFADDKPNGNNQGIAYEDFEDVKQSGIDMPIKMKFLGEAGAGGHTGSVTFGHIKDIEEDVLADGTHRLIANGVLYASEYPEEVKYLDAALAEGKAPGASWEVVYSDVEKDGPVSWLKKIVTSAATFVRNPAYGTRTALLALASTTDITDEELSKELLGIVEEIRPKINVEGGSNTVEKELEKLQAELDAKVEELKTAKELNETLTTAKAELETKITSQDEVIAEFKKSQLIADRTAKVAEAGLKVETDADKLSKKQEYWISLSEDQFAEYLADLQSAASAKEPLETKKGLAALLNNPVPRVDPKDGDESISYDELKASFRSRNRGSVE